MPREDRWFAVALLVTWSTVGRAGDTTKNTPDDIFPETGGVTVLNDSNLVAYRAVATRDAVAFACEQFQAYQDRCTKAEESKFAAESLRKAASKDPAVKGALDVWRTALMKREFVVSSERGEDSVSYKGGRFSLGIASIDEGGTSWDKLQQSVILGGGGNGVAVGTWKRVTWVRNTVMPGASAYVVLTGIPESLKGRIETELGKTIHLRWRWKGLAKTQTHRSTPIMGFIMTNTWLTPDPLALEFLEGDTLLWRFQ